MGILRSRIKFIVLFPMSLIFLGDAFFLALSRAPILLLANFLFFAISMAFTLVMLKRITSELEAKMKQVQENIENVNFASKLLSKELNTTIDIQSKINLTPQLEEVYNEIKELTIMSLNLTDKSGANGKELIIVAKRLSILCTQIKQIEWDFNEDRLKKRNIVQYERLFLITENLIGRTEEKPQKTEVRHLNPASFRRVLKRKVGNAA